LVTSARLASRTEIRKINMDGGFRRMGFGSPCFMRTA
jgi:hypothetical protein